MKYFLSFLFTAITLSSFSQISYGGNPDSIWTSHHRGDPAPEQIKTSIRNLLSLDTSKIQTGLDQYYYDLAINYMWHSSPFVYRNNDLPLTKEYFDSLYIANLYKVIAVNEARREKGTNTKCSAWSELAHHYSYKIEGNCKEPTKKQDIDDTLKNLFMKAFLQCKKCGYSNTNLDATYFKLTGIKLE